MNIIVCIKQVPGTTEVKIDPQTHTLVREGIESIINPYDTYAIEEALRLKQKLGGRVTVITMGPPQADEALKEAISLGADDAILLTDKTFAGSDTLATSYTLTQAVKKIGQFNLIICGKQTMDGDTGQVGPELAHMLDLPHITYVSKVEEVDEIKLRVRRLVEEGYEVMEMSLPGVITVVKEINEPRMPSLKGLMRAKKEEITCWGAVDLEGAEQSRFGLDGSPTQVIRVFTPEPPGKGEIIKGEPQEQAKKLVEGLKKTKIL